MDRDDPKTLGYTLKTSNKNYISTFVRVIKEITAMDITPYSNYFWQTEKFVCAGYVQRTPRRNAANGPIARREVCSRLNLIYRPFLWKHTVLASWKPATSKVRPKH